MENKIEIAFIIFTVAVTLAVFVVADLVVALNFLIACFAAVAVYMLYMGLDYFALVVIIIYIGAIAVLFLFIIMMIEQKRYKAPLVKTITYSLAAIFFINYHMYTGVFSFFFEEPSRYDFLGRDENIILAYVTHMKLGYLLGLDLYVAKGAIFIMNSIILLVGMLGAILLTLSTTTSLRKQEDYKQILMKSGHQRLVGQNLKKRKTKKHKTNKYL